jgi:ABC-type phosphate/phosphonate transport system permease subunit
MQQAVKPESGFARWLLSLLGAFMVSYSLYRFRKFHVPMFFMGLFGGFFIGIFISLAFSSVSGVSNFYIMAFMCGICMTFFEYKAYEMNKSKPS